MFKLFYIMNIQLKIFLTSCFVMLLAAAQAQPNATYFNDGEFDELALRKKAALYGWQGDSLNEMVAQTLEDYLLYKEQIKMLSPGYNSTLSAPSPTYCVPGAIPPSFSKTEFDMMGKHQSVCSEMDFFEITPTHPDPLGGWTGQTGTYNGNWVYYPFPAAGSGISSFHADQHAVVHGNGLDPYGKFPIVAPGSVRSFRLGNIWGGFNSEKLLTQIVVNRTDVINPEDLYFTYRYALVLEDPGVSHGIIEKPSFKVSVYEKLPDGTLKEVCCARYEVYADEKFPGFKGANIRTKDWATNIIKLKDLWPTASVDLTTPSKEYLVEFTTRDCIYGGHGGYAYVDGGCIQPSLKKIGRSCAGLETSFTSEVLGLYPLELVTWNFDDGTPTQTFNVDYANADKLIVRKDVPNINNPLFISHKYMLPGTYTVTLTVKNNNPDMNICSPITLTKTVNIDNCITSTVSCTECIQTFAPIPGKKYVLSAWVSERTSDYTPSILAKYDKPSIVIRFNGPNTNVGPFKAKGKVIDGWQKIEEAFDIPEGTNSIEVILNNQYPVDVNGNFSICVLESNPDPVYFDDVRIYPFDASLKSFVYDPKSQKLMAELDENNFATFYEYDEEGKLIRLKKETEKGVSTIKESVSNTHKK